MTSKETKDWLAREEERVTLELAHAYRVDEAIMKANKRDRLEQRRMKCLDYAVQLCSWDDETAAHDLVAAAKVIEDYLSPFDVEA